MDPAAATRMPLNSPAYRSAVSQKFTVPSAQIAPVVPFELPTFLQSVSELTNAPEIPNVYVLLRYPDIVGAVYLGWAMTSVGTNTHAANATQIEPSFREFM